MVSQNENDRSTLTGKIDSILHARGQDLICDDRSSYVRTWPSSRQTDSRVLVGAVASVEDGEEPAHEQLPKEHGRAVATRNRDFQESWLAFGDHVVFWLQNEVAHFAVDVLETVSYVWRRPTVVALQPIHDPLEVGALGRIIRRATVHDELRRCAIIDRTFKQAAAAAPCRVAVVLVVVAVGSAYALVADEKAMQIDGPIMRLCDRKPNKLALIKPRVTPPHRIASMPGWYFA